MRKAFSALDDMLIERVFQPLSDLITHQVGLSRADLACCCIDAASLAWIVSRSHILSAAVVDWDVSAAFTDLAFLLLGLIAMISLRMVFRRSASRRTNPLRQTMQPHRAVSLLMLMARLLQFRSLAVIDVADGMMLLCAAFALYLGACEEPPPAHRAKAAFAPAS